MSVGDFAIIGYAGRFPGAPDARRFWANLRDGVESVRFLTDDELLAAGVTEAQLEDPDYVKACPVFDGVDQFDAAFFGFTPREAAVMDPAHRIMLEVAWEAMEHAGHTGLPEEGPVGVFVGSGAPYYLMDHVRRDRAIMRSMGEFLVRHTNNDMNFLSTRVSYEMDLRGPSINVQTACSSALVSVHVACESIRRGECRMALAGGSTVIIPDRHGYRYAEGEIMSPDGHCRPFDARSAGTIFGSGSGCLVIRPLSDALDDGDTVHAVIRGSAVTNDGAMRVGFLAPGVEGQSAAVEAALDAAGVAADSITYIEAHGTGTSVGDPIEVAALNQAFRPRTAKRRFCAIGSVKSNVGHLGEAAGAPALIKAIMALGHREIPPSLNWEAPNPQIDFEDSPFYVNDRLSPWTAPGPLRCGVTSLGAGGTNCHMILEEPPAPLEPHGARSAQLMVLSARTPQALERRRHDLADHLESDPSVALADAAWTLAVGRRPMAHRYVAAGGDRDAILSSLRDPDERLAFSEHADENERGVVFTFPGGGAQYPGMGADLYEDEPEYREAADDCLRIIDPILGRSLSALVFCDPAETEGAARELERPSLALPALFTTSYALARLLQSWGIEPGALLGHSMGEYVAACLSGVMSLEDALRMVMERGRLFEQVPRGGMLSVPLSESELRAILPRGLDIGVVNASELCVASGPVELIDELERRLSERDLESTRIRIEVAAHSSMLEPILDDFGRFCRTVRLSPPTIPFVSNVTGTWITSTQATDPDYWVDHLRSTVRFADCLETVQSAGDVALLEVGPGRTLTSLARAQAAPAPFAYNSMRHPDVALGDVEVALGVVGQLWLAGVPIDWTAVYDGQLLNRIALPAYAWDHERHWIDARPVGGEDEPDDTRREQVQDWFSRPVWRQTVPPVARPATDIDTTAPVPLERRVLLFGDRTGLGDALAGSLTAAGDRVIRVSAGERWEREGDRITMRPASWEDHEQLVHALVSDGGIPASVVHTWSVTEGPDAGEEAGVSRKLDRTLELGFHSLHAFARAVSSEDPDAAFTLNVVTRSLHRIGGAAELDATQALVLGPARVMPREFTNVRTRTIDVTPPISVAERGRLASRLAAEITAPFPDATDASVAWRGHDRFESSVDRIYLDQARQRLREGGVYLLTGGLGGIGYALAEHLASTYRAKLVLIGRSASPQRAQPRSDALRDLGAEVEVMQADVTDVDQMRSVVERARERFGRLDGVFHVAGVLADSLMPLKTREDAERVLAPKVQGTLALDAALGETPLDLFVLFSSISSSAGLAGQSDYTAANAFLDAYAHERDLRHGGLTISVNWSAWRDVGMAANLVSGTGASASGMEGEIHPVLGHLLWAGADHDLFSSELSVADDWILSEHRVRGGRALMPGTGIVELVRAAVDARPERGILEISDLAFISAFVAPEDGARELRVRVDRRAGAKQSVAIAGVIPGENGGQDWQEHATASAEYVDASAPAPLELADIRERCDVREEVFAPDQESVNMDFGRRWKNVRSIRFGRDEALVSLELPAAFASDHESFALHPPLLDMATGRCEALFEGFDPANDFYVPLSYTRLRFFAPLTSRIFSHVRLVPSEFDPSEILVFDVTVTDETGRVLVEIDEFVMTRVANADELQEPAGRGDAGRTVHRFEPPAASSGPTALLQWMDGAISTAEGMEALDRILAGPDLQQVYVTPLSAGVLIEQLRTPPPEADRDEGGQSGTRAMTADHVAPANDLERAIAEIWGDVLGYPAVGTTDNFFALGGHSLLLMKVVSRLRKEVGLTTPLSDLFDTPTIQAWVTGMEDAPEAAAPRSAPLGRVSRDAYVVPE